MNQTFLSFHCVGFMSMAERKRLKRWESVVVELCGVLSAYTVHYNSLYDHLIRQRENFGSLKGKDLRLIVSALAYAYLSEKGCLNWEIKNVLKNFARVKNFRQIPAVLSDLKIKRNSLTAFKNTVSTAIMHFAKDKSSEAIERFEQKLQNTKNYTFSKIATAGYEALIESGINLTKSEFAKAVGISHQIIV